MAFRPSVAIHVDVLDADYIPGEGTVERWTPVEYTMGGMHGGLFSCAWDAPSAEDVTAAGATQSCAVATIRMAYHPVIYAAGSIDTQHLRVRLCGEERNEWRLVTTAENVAMANTEMVLRVKRWEAR